MRNFMCFYLLLCVFLIHSFASFAQENMLGNQSQNEGIFAVPSVQKVEIDISTTADKIGKWQGAFGSSTTVDPDYWTQTEKKLQIKVGGLMRNNCE